MWRTNRWLWLVPKRRAPKVPTKTNPPAEPRPVVTGGGGFKGSKARRLKASINKLRGYCQEVLHNPTVVRQPGTLQAQATGRYSYNASVSGVLQFQYSPGCRLQCGHFCTGVQIPAEPGGYASHLLDIQHNTAHHQHLPSFLHFSFLSLDGHFLLGNIFFCLCIETTVAVSSSTSELLLLISSS